jgi:hypothetical protein
MAKAVNRNGTIRVYGSTPKSFNGNNKVYLTGFDQLTEAEQKSEGLFDVVMPSDYDSRIHDLGDIYWDSANTRFTYPKTNKTWSQTLSELKTQAIANLKANANRKLAETDWYVVRNAEDSTKAIPASVTTDRAAIRTSVTTKETAINALNTKAAVIKFDISLD